MYLDNHFNCVAKLDSIEGRMEILRDSTYYLKENYRLFYHS